MPQSLPDFALTQGQLFWALGHGREADQLLKDQVRYLRQLGIPKKSQDQAPGKGNRIHYDFFDLVEMGVAVKALKLRFRPKDIASMLVSERAKFRNLVRSAWLELPDEALTADWIKSRGRKIPVMENEFFIRLHDRRSENWGKLDLVTPQEVGPDLELFAMIERFDDGDVLPIIPLYQSMLPWYAWALDAPAIRTGPK